MLYFSVTFMVATSSWLSLSISATSSFMPIDFAISSVVESVIGIGQNKPFLLGICIFSQTACQSALPMKPSSGVNAPMPIMIRSPLSRLVIGTFFMVCARLISAALASPSSKKAFQFRASMRWNELTHKFS